MAHVLGLAKSLCWGKNVVQGEFASSVGASGGLITLWEEDFFEVESKIISQRYILLVGVLKLLKLKCEFGNIYAPNYHGEKQLLWEELVILLSNMVLPWCLGANFNIVRRPDEKIGVTLNQLVLS